jgi:6-phosphogluconolactonase
MSFWRNAGAVTLATLLGLITEMLNAQAATIVYVGNTDSSEIFVLGLNPQSGELNVVEKTVIPDVAKPGGSTPMAISPDRKFLYAGLRGEPIAAASFAIDPASGKLRHLSTAALPDSMAYISTDRTGRFLLSASYGGHKVAINPIKDGQVQKDAVQVVATQPNAHSIMTDRSNRFVFATNLGGDIIMQQKFDDKTGMISPNTPPTVSTKKGAGPRHLVFHPNDKFVYLISELDATINVYGFDSTMGLLSELQTVTALPSGFQGKPWAADIHLTPDGKFLYGSERTSNTLAAFQVDAGSGGLTPIGSFPTETQPRGFAIDSRGRYLLSVGQLSHSLTVHAIDGSSGKLTTVKQYPVGKNPNWVEIVELP